MKRRLLSGSFPVAALRLPHDTRERLEALGLNTIEADVLRSLRETLAAADIGVIQVPRRLMDCRPWAFWGPKPSYANASRSRSLPTASGKCPSRIALPSISFAGNCYGSSCRW